MATSKPDPASDVPSEAPGKPSKAREQFLAGEIGWNDYIDAENAVAEKSKPADK